MEVAPGDEEGENLGFAGAGGHFDDEARPIFIEHIGGYGTGGVEAQEIELIAGGMDVVEPDDTFDGFALGEIVAELVLGGVGLFGEMGGFKPPGEQGAGGGGGAGIAGIAPGSHVFANVGDEGWEEFFVGGAAQFFGGGEPALVWGEDLVW